MRDDGLFDLLIEEGFDERFADGVIDAGYFLHFFADWFGSTPYPAVMDGFYGRKRSGMIKTDDFFAYLKGKTLPKPERTTAIYRNIKSVNQVFEILANDRHKYFFTRNILSFRGQAGNHLRNWNGDRMLKRRIPNPYVCDAD